MSDTLKTLTCQHQETTRKAHKWCHFLSFSLDGLRSVWSYELEGITKSTLQSLFVPMRLLCVWQTKEEDISLIRMLG